MAERENKKKLSKDELHEENQKIQKSIRTRDYTSKEEQERLVNSLRTVNLLAYALVLLLPVIGVFVIWKKQKDLKLNNPSVYLWTGIGAIVLVKQVQMILTHFGVIG